ncbi:hypothetical protein FOCC_FOCC003444 [Frankliniella occidentalis]|nr:hypothetical protein FOCC_FOCC003444 [Frankliniella occidentalis]
MFSSVQKSTVMIPTMMRFLAEQSESRKKMVPWEKNPHEVNHCEMNNRTGLPLYREILDNFTAEDYARDLFNNLTVLDLSHNFLTQITQAEMWTFARARELVLSHNYLRRLPCAPFFFMNRLEALRLSGNPWGEVRPDYFAGLEALRVVECRHCLIATFDHLATSQLEHIEELDVGDNFIETIGADQVLVLKRLQKLQLDGNRLKTVSHCVFVYNQNLKIIKLQGNDVDDTVFRDHGECAHRLQE